MKLFNKKNIFIFVALSTTFSPFVFADSDSVDDNLYEKGRIFSSKLELSEESEEESLLDNYNTASQINDYINNNLLEVMRFCESFLESKFGASHGACKDLDSRGLSFNIFLNDRFESKLKSYISEINNLVYLYGSYLFTLSGELSKVDGDVPPVDSDLQKGLKNQFSFFEFATLSIDRLTEAVKNGKLSYINFVDALEDEVKFRRDQVFQNLMYDKDLQLFVLKPGADLPMSTLFDSAMKTSSVALKSDKIRGSHFSIGFNGKGLNVTFIENDGELFLKFNNVDIGGIRVLTSSGVQLKELLEPQTYSPVGKQVTTYVPVDPPKTTKHFSISLVSFLKTALRTGAPFWEDLGLRSFVGRRSGQVLVRLGEVHSSFPQPVKEVLAKVVKGHKHFVDVTQKMLRTVQDLPSASAVLSSPTKQGPLAFLKKILPSSKSVPTAGNAVVPYAQPETFETLIKNKDLWISFSSNILMVFGVEAIDSRIQGVLARVMPEACARMLSHTVTTPIYWLPRALTTQDLAKQSVLLEGFVTDVALNVGDVWNCAHQLFEPLLPKKRTFKKNS